MTAPSQAALDIQEVPHLLSKHRRLLMVGTLLGGLVAGMGSHFIPRRYKSHFVLTIYSKYFQSPLIGDFVPSSGDFSDSRALRESLIRQALTPELLDALGQKYGIYVAPKTGGGAPASPVKRLSRSLKHLLAKLDIIQPSNPESLLSNERQNMLGRVEIFSLNNTTFNVGFSYSNPRVAFSVAQELHGEILKSLVDARTNMLLRVRDAIHRRLATISTSASSPSRSGDGASLRQQLKAVRDELRSLTVTYTESHPLVQQLREKEKALARSIASNSAARIPASGAPLPEGDGSSTLHDISGDLAKKLNYLDIAIDSDSEHQGDYFATLEPPLFPTSPSGPGPALFLIGGLAFGCICAGFIAAIREYFHRSAVRSSTVARRLGVPVLGELPALPQQVSEPAQPAAR